MPRRQRTRVELRTHSTLFVGLVLSLTLHWAAVSVLMALR